MKITIVLFCLLLSMSLNAQVNLHLNQILTYSGNLSGPNIQSGPVWTVPAGRVWKIENKTRTGFTNLMFYVNNVSVNDLYLRENVWGNQSNGYAAMAVDNSAIWLKEGDAIKFQQESNWQGSSNNYFISILEFLIN